MEYADVLWDGCTESESESESESETESESDYLEHVQYKHRVDKTYRDVTDRCKHCGRLRYHVPTFFQAIGRKMINCACSASLK
jgi:hypothetical protein